MQELYALLNKAAATRRFSPEDKRTATALFEPMHALLETRRSPPGFRLASGEQARGATGRTALNAYFLLLGRLALGPHYARLDARMGYWSMHLGFHIMRSHFVGRSEKGLYCCATCTLSVLPLYGTHALAAFDCDRLKANVLKAVAQRQDAFACKSYSKAYERWALRFA